MNSNPCEVTVHTQREKKRKEKKRRKTWKGKCSINLYPNTHLIYFSKKNCTFTVHVTFFQSFDVLLFNFSYIIFPSSHLLTFFTDLTRPSSSIFYFLPFSRYPLSLLGSTHRLALFKKKKKNTHCFVLCFTNNDCKGAKMEL